MFSLWGNSFLNRKRNPLQRKCQSVGRERNRERKRERKRESQKRNMGTGFPWIFSPSSFLSIHSKCWANWEVERSERKEGKGERERERKKEREGERKGERERERERTCIKSGQLCASLSFISSIHSVLSKCGADSPVLSIVFLSPFHEFPLPLPPWAQLVHRFILDSSLFLSLSL